jgi:RecJ-like exonuclease
MKCITCNGVAFYVKEMACQVCDGIGELVVCLNCGLNLSNSSGLCQNCFVKKEEKMNVTIDKLKDLVRKTRHKLFMETEYTFAHE